MCPAASHPEGRGCRLLTPTAVVVAAAAAMLETRTAAVTGSKAKSEEALGPTSALSCRRAGGRILLPAVISFVSFLHEAAAEGLISRIGETARPGILACSA